MIEQMEEINITKILPDKYIRVLRKFILGCHLTDNGS